MLQPTSFKPSTISRPFARPPLLQSAPSISFKGSLSENLSRFCIPGTKIVADNNVFNPDFITSIRAISKRSPLVFLDLDHTLLAVNLENGEVSVRPGALEFLSQLKQNGYQVIIWTGGKGEYAKNSLEKAGLDKMIDLIVARESCDPRKLSYEASEAFTKLLGLDFIESFFYSMPGAKPVGLLAEKGRAVLIDDNKRIESEAKAFKGTRYEYRAIVIYQFDPIYGIGPITALNYSDISDKLPIR